LAKGDSSKAGSMYGSLASVLGNMLDFDASLNYFEKAADLLAQQRDSLGHARMLNNQGVIYLNLGQYAQALRKLNAALAIRERLPNRNGLAYAFAAIGTIHYLEHEYGQARFFAEKAAVEGKLAGSLIQQEKAAMLLTLIASAQDQPEVAQEFLQTYEGLQDSLLNQANIRAQAEIELRYQFEREQLADSLLFVQKQVETELTHQQSLAWRNLGILLLGSFAVLVVFWLRNRQQFRLKEQALALQQERARQQQLEELAALKSEFFTNISHEFRTPLTVILGMAQHINAQPQKASQLIQQNGQHLLQLVNQVLELSRLEAGHGELNWEQREVRSYLSYLVESYQSLVKEKQLTLHSEWTFDSQLMDLEREKLQQVMENLLSNAIRFSPTGGHISLTSWIHGDELMVSVKDEGPGISPEHLPRIFDRFFQAPHQSPQQSTGIGLALVQALVKLMGGNITAESTIGEGACFTFSLPIHQRSLPAKIEVELALPMLAMEALAKSPQPMEKSEAPEILVVEDNPDVRFYLHSILSTNFQVHLAGDGKAGLELAQEKVPDLILTDVMMPQINGYSLAKRLKEDERTSHIPLIMLTARASQADKMAGLREGIDAYLIKPFDQQELLLRIHKLLEQRQRLHQHYLKLAGLEEASPMPSSLHALPSREELFLQKVMEVIDSHLAEPELNVHLIARQVHLSQTQTYRKIKALTGQTPTLLIRSRRLQAAKTLIGNRQFSISEVGYQVGFNDPNYFSRIFFKEFGVRPSVFRENLAKSGEK
ncbi:MAG: ATP-binding protein, partial [Bacteroidota bacterium]